MRLSLVAALGVGLSVPAVAHADVLTVGPGKSFATPCAAIAAAVPGDVIEIDAGGSYDGDVCGWSTDGLTLRGVGGRPHIDAAGQNAQGKGTWVIAGDDTLIENVELSGATVPDENGAAIRQEGANLTVRGCSFHDNENGILAGDNLASEILIEESSFSDNGFGDGFTHNFYINHVAKFTLRFSYSTRANIGQLVKSRAKENFILYNRLSSEDGATSYEIDLSNGGESYVIGNLIQQGAAAENGGMLAYQQEGSTANNPSDQLYVAHNTFVNDRPNGGTFIVVGGSVTTPVIARNNIFMGPGTVCSQGSAVLEGNLVGDPSFVDKDGFDYHLSAGSLAVDAGVDPGAGSLLSLTPSSHYVHPTGSEGRMTVGTIDVGAYELGGGFGASGSGGGGAGTAGSGGAGGAVGGAGGAGPTGAGGSGGAYADPASDGAADADDGCACRAAGRPRGVGTRAAIAVALGASLWLARRRRRPSPSTT